MKLTTIVAVIAAIGAEVALARPVAQQAPVRPNPVTSPSTSHLMHTANLA